jgi:hypothetical protein
MKLTSVIRELEAGLKNAEKFARQYDDKADEIREKLADVARAVGNEVARALSPKKEAASSTRSSEGRGKTRSRKK